jgi:hypothetical protein
MASIIAPPARSDGNAFPARCGQAATDRHAARAPGLGHGGRRPGIEVALPAGMKTTTSFDSWSTEQVLLVYERYFGTLDPKARRRIVEDARLNGWDRTWSDGLELLAA